MQCFLLGLFILCLIISAKWSNAPNTIYLLWPNYSQKRCHFNYFNPMSLIEYNPRNKNIFMKIHIITNILNIYCNCTTPHQAPELRIKTEQLHVFHSRNSAGVKHLVKPEKLWMSRRNFIAQAETRTAFWINQFLLWAGIFIKQGWGTTQVLSVMLTRKETLFGFPLTQWVICFLLVWNEVSSSKLLILFPKPRKLASKSSQEHSRSFKNEESA